MFVRKLTLRLKPNMFTQLTWRGANYFRRDCGEAIRQLSEAQCLSLR
jgi:hypothetical protein